jgi:hypothetical protein
MIEEVFDRSDAKPFQLFSPTWADPFDELDWFFQRWEEGTRGGWGSRRRVL